MNLFLVFFSSSCLSGINGVLFTGGGLSLHKNTTYYQTALHLITRIKQANDAGDIFPLWGTCMGFQLIHLLIAQPIENDSILTCNFDSENLELPLLFTSQASESKLFRNAMKIPASFSNPDISIYDTFATQSITHNLHHCGITPANFASSVALVNTLHILSTSIDRKGQEFVSTVEGINYPIFATQWHGERPQFEWDVNEALSHLEETYHANAYVSSQFVSIARMNTHTFPSVDVENAALIYNFVPFYNVNDSVDSFPSRLIYQFDGLQ